MPKINNNIQNSALSRRQQVVEINLIPDVKRELIKAQATRSRVITIAVLVSISAVALVVLLSLINFGVQGVMMLTADRGIKDEFERYQKYAGVNQIITLQNQLANIDATHKDKPITSRLMSLVISAVNGSDKAVKISKVSYDSQTRTVVLEGQSAREFSGLDQFKKSILATKFEYQDQDERHEGLVTDKIEEVETPNYNENSNGDKILVFRISFVVDDEVFANIKTDLLFKGPKRSDVTDSSLVIPSDIFTSSVPSSGANLIEENN